MASDGCGSSDTHNRPQKRFTSLRFEESAVKDGPYKGDARSFQYSDCSTNDTLPCLTRDSLPCLTRDSLPCPEAFLSQDRSDASSASGCESDSTAPASPSSTQSLTMEERKEKWLQRRQERKAKAKSRPGVGYAYLLKKQVQERKRTHSFRAEREELPKGMLFGTNMTSEEEVPRLVRQGEDLEAIQSTSEVASSTDGGSDVMSRVHSRHPTVDSLPRIADDSDGDTGDNASETEENPTSEDNASVDDDGDAATDFEDYEAKSGEEDATFDAKFDAAVDSDQDLAEDFEKHVAAYLGEAPDVSEDVAPGGDTGRAPVASYPELAVADLQFALAQLSAQMSTCVGDAAEDCGGIQVNQFV